MSDLGMNHTPRTKPPRLALWLHERSLPPAEREPVIGDLVEEFETRSERDPRAAHRWVWSQTWRSLVPNLRRRFVDPPLTPAAAPEEGARMLNGIATDVRFALRLFRRQPLTTMVAFVSLSAGLGLNILLLSLADAVLFRPLPLLEPERLVVLLTERESGLNHNFSYPDYRVLAERTRTLEGVVAYSSAEAVMAGADGAVPVSGEMVSGNFFALLGAPVLTGRPLTDADDRPAAPPAAIISEALWRDRFASTALGSLSITLNGQPYTVVGVARSRFDGMDVGKRASFWVPLAHSRTITGDDLIKSGTASWLTLVGRVPQGQSAAAARAELDGILRAAFESSGRKPAPVVLRPGARGDSTLSETLGDPMRLLMIAGALVLLVACLNVANLQLARAEARRLELAVRSALGARRGQLVRLVFVDALVMALAAGASGVWMAALLKDRAAGLIAFWGQPVAIDVPLDVRVVASALGLSLLAALVVGGISTWQTVRRRAIDDLGDGRTFSSTRPLAQRAVVVAQVALSMALLTGASLLVRTLDHLRGTDLGFDPRGVAVVEVSPEMGRLPRPDRAAYFDNAIRALTALPGVRDAAASHVMPLAFGGSRTSIEIQGYTPRPDEDMELNFVRVTPGYFQTLGLPLRDGRAFDERDIAGQPERIVVNETMARRFWPDGRAVGRFVRFGSRDPYNVEVVGVVPDAHYRMVREDPHASFYVPLAQWPSDSGVIHISVAGDPTARLDELRRVVAAVNPAVPVVRAHTLLDQIERNISDERMAMAIGLTLASVALLLAAAGLYATMAFVVNRRTREIGVRLALGATVTEVRAMVLKEGLMLTLLGIGGGLALAIWAGNALRAQLYGVDATDVPSLIGAALVLAASALAASWLPARRATKVDPVVALKDA